MVGLRIFAKILAFSTFLLIFAGSLVTSTGTGLSVPDWPTTYGHFMFSFPLKNMVGGIFFEHGHRLIASLVGILTVILFVWIMICVRELWLRRLGGLALILVILQGVLGGITVRFFLPAAVSVAHAVMAQTFFLLVLFLAYATSKERSSRLRAADSTADHGINSHPSSIMWGLVIAVYVQLILGTIMRHTESGLAVPDFPTMGGHWLPWIDAAALKYINDWRFVEDLPPVAFYQIIFNLLHRAGAILVLVMTVRLLVRPVLRQRWRGHVSLIGLVVGLQLVLGAVTLLSKKQPWVTSLHVLTGALTLALCFLLALRASPVTWRPIGSVNRPKK